MKTVIAGALGECVHVAGVMNFLDLAEAAGWKIIFLGPAVPLEQFLAAITGQTVPANITGNNFLTGATVMLIKPGESNLSATVAGVVASKITCSLNLAGAAAGPWSVVVTNPDGKESLISNGFDVVNPAPTVTAINPSGGPITG